MAPVSNTEGRLCLPSAKLRFVPQNLQRDSSFAYSWISGPARLLPLACSYSLRVATLHLRRSEIHHRRKSLCSRNTLNRSGVRQSKIADLRTTLCPGPTGKCWQMLHATLKNLPIPLCWPKLQSTRTARLLICEFYASPIRIPPIGSKSTRRCSQTLRNGITNRLSIKAYLWRFAVTSL